MKTSISDTDKYKNVIKQMLLNENTFNNFKRLPDYTEILEHVNYDMGRKYIDIIKRDNPHLFDEIAKFKDNDLYGNPTKVFYPEVGQISPSTLRYIKVLSDIIKSGNDLNNKNIIEIGVGYGGQCLIISKYFNFKSYVLVDLKDPLELSKKYLNLNKINNVTFKEMDELENDTQYDMVISNYAFSECTKEIQDIYFHKVIKNSNRGYITLNFISDIFGINSYTKEELSSKIENSYMIDEEPISYSNNVILLWQKSPSYQE